MYKLFVERKSAFELYTQLRELPRLLTEGHDLYKQGHRWYITDINGLIVASSKQYETAGAYEVNE